MFGMTKNYFVYITFNDYPEREYWTSVWEIGTNHLSQLAMHEMVKDIV